jgi:hypothetical protein
MQTVEFDNSKFDKSVAIINAEFQKDLKLNNCELPENLYLQNVKSIGSIDLLTTRLINHNNKCKLYITNTDISKIKLKMDRFQLAFPDSTNMEVINGTYESLLNNFKVNGYTDSYKELDLDHRHWLLVVNGNIFDKAGYFIQIWWWEFGYSKRKVILNTLCILCLLIATTSFKILKLQKDIYPMEFIEKDMKRNDVRVNSVVYRIKISIFYVSAVFFGLKFNFSKLKRVNIYSFYLLAIYVVGLFCSLFFLYYLFKG